jgi:serine/threonine protein kinase
VYQEWNSKVKKEMWYKGNIAIKIPKVKNLNGHYLMEDLTDYISLKRVLQKEFIKQDFSWKIRFDVDSLSTHELYTLSKELWVEFANDYMKARFPIMDLKDFELIKNFLWYANESGLFHKDIQVGNIMVPKNMSRPLKSVYIIDFWRVVQGWMNPFLKNRENISVKTVANRIQTSEYAYSDVLNFDYLKKNLVK